MEIIKGGVTAAKGFQAAAAAAGIKYADRTDMAMIYSEKPCKIAGTFTSNIVKAAPVKWDRAVVESGVKSQAVIVNSGIANACTGEEGERICRETAEKAAEVLGIDKGSLQPGKLADIVIFDPEKTYRIDASLFASKSRNTPFQGREVTGAVRMTIAGGEIIYQAE